MSVCDVAICRTGTANLASVMAALARADALPHLDHTPGEIVEASHVMLPGVGSFGAAMATLERSGAADALKERLARGRPILAICVGLQLLCRASEESPGVSGLGLIDETVTRFPAHVRVPQFGWNAITPTNDGMTLQAGHAYFANSYRLEVAPAGWGVAMSNHGGPFVAALQKGALVACQFHPELSGSWGESLIRRWLATSC